MDKDYKLLPCPKCGAKAEFWQYDSESWRIGCEQKYWICNFEIASTDRNILIPWWNSLPRAK